MILTINYFTYALLILPIILCVFIYFWKLVRSENEILFGELYLFLMTLSFCTYILLHYRIHHSYKDINEVLIFDSILIFYLFLIPFYLIYFVLQKKNLDLSKINLNFINKLSNFLKNQSGGNSANKNRIRIIFFITIGLAMSLLNRSDFFNCDNLLLNNLFQDLPVIKKKLNKIHTISFFGIFALMLGLILFYNEISLAKKTKFKILYFILILPSFFLLILSHTGGSGLIIMYFLVVLLIFTKNNKNIFQFHIIFLIISIFVLMTAKKEIRAAMPSDNACVVGFRITADGALKGIYNKFNDSNMSYNNVLGEIIKIKQDEVSNLRFKVANFFERIDFIQMLAQTKMLIDNNILEYKKGETYLNREINWKKEFGVDIKQTSKDIPSAFNLPAIVESYYNFGAYGILIFSIIAAIMCLIIFKIINYYKNNFYLQSVLIISFSHFLIHENDFIFSVKNVIFCFALLISLTIFLEFLIKLNSKIKHITSK